MEQDTVQKIIAGSPAIGSILGGIFLSLLIDYVTPGRKGRLRTERDHYFANFQTNAVRKEMEKRLVAEAFEVLPSTDPNLLRAKRPKGRPRDSVMKDYPFNKMKLELEVQFTPREDGCIAKMAVSTPAYITRDTGESEYFEAVLDYLMFRPDLHPMGEVEHLSAVLPLRTSTILVFLPALFFIPGMEQDYAKWYMQGLVWTSAAWVAIGGWGLLQIKLNPGKYKGTRQALLGIGLAALTAAITLGIYYFVKK